MRKTVLIIFCFALGLVRAQAEQTTEGPRSVPTSSATSKMTNADIIQMVTAGLSDQIIITSIRQAPTKDFDLTTTGLIALKKAGVSDALFLVIQNSDAHPAALSDGSASSGGYAASARVGRYVRKDKSSDSYFELTADGQIHLFQGGKSYNGTYSVHGDVITVQAKNIRGNGEHFVGNTIVEADGTVWVKGEGMATPSTQIQDSSVAAEPMRPPAAPVAQNACSNIEFMGVGQIEGGPALGGVNIYVATIRNKAAYTMEVDIEYIKNGGAAKGTWNVKAGEKIEARLDVNNRPPTNVRITACR